VLSARARGEADRIYSVLTSEFGLVRAKASGVRNEVSKLRAALEPLSFSTISFVRGKEYWRITGATLDLNVAKEFKNNRPVLLSFVQALSLVEKLVVGESRHPELLDQIEEAMNFAKREEMSLEDIKSFEAWIVLRVLFELGYISGDDLPDGILTSAITAEILETITKNKKSVIESINSGIRASGLTK
jgi:recombinational DNA repair protein (RecF pathway)